jgi:hypothetical protein
MKITPINKAGLHKTGTLVDITVDEINVILGFTPNVKDDTFKVKHSWGFKVEGKECGIWDYKGSEEYRQFSTYGSDAVFKELFGFNYGR